MDSLGHIYINYMPVSSVTTDLEREI